LISFICVFFLAYIWKKRRSSSINQKQMCVWIILRALYACHHKYFLSPLSIFLSISQGHAKLTELIWAAPRELILARAVAVVGDVYSGSRTLFIFFQATYTYACTRVECHFGGLTAQISQRPLHFWSTRSLSDLLNAYTHELL
jgi:hypothetical protein